MPTYEGKPVFKTAAIDHSATSPSDLIRFNRQRYVIIKKRRRFLKITQNSQLSWCYLVLFGESLVNAKTLGEF